MSTRDHFGLIGSKYSYDLDPIEERGLMLDGFPRNVEQMEHVQDVVAKDHSGLDWIWI